MEKFIKNSTIKIYYNPLDISIFLRFENAVRVLSTEAGELNKRLYKAYNYCGIIHLDSGNFNDEFIRKNLEDIQNIIREYNDLIDSFNVSPEIRSHAWKFNIHWKKSVKMANCIFSIYKYLVELRILEKKNDK